MRSKQISIALEPFPAEPMATQQLPQLQGLRFTPLHSTPSTARFPWRTSRRTHLTEPWLQALSCSSGADKGCLHVDAAIEHQKEATQA